ncbi:MAG: branched-chain amino acid ABC transporter permease [Lachnospiraceae bacterium]|nr:branched-chain amino acid ABC transporter permease [Lachnospiraceae bacterium]
MSFLNYLINGLSLGSVYAIIALGYTMVYGIAKMLNFAHGDIIMVGSYIVYSAMSMAGMHPAIAILIAMVGCMVLGVVTERVAYRPLRGASSSLAVLITAIGVSYLLQNIALLVFGADTKAFTSVINWKGITLFDGELQIRGTTIITIAVGLLVLFGLQAFIHRTKSGQAMLAVAQDRGAATLCGIDVNKTIAITFAIGSSLAAVAGVLFCSTYPTITPYIGSMPGIKAFVAAVFGGIGSIPGAMIGGLTLGVIEILSRTYISSQLSEAIVFAILIVVLLVKPTGLLGKRVMEKV